MSKQITNSGVCGSIHMCYIEWICSIPKGCMLATFPQNMDTDVYFVLRVMAQNLNICIW